MAQRRDGGWGWMVVASGFIIGFLCDGIRSSFGFVFIEFLREFHQSKAVTSWVGGLMFGLMNLLGPITSVLVHSFGCRMVTIVGVVICVIGYTISPVTSVLVHRFGCRAVTVVGALICATGYTISVFSTSVYYLYVSLGLLGGMGFSMLIIPYSVILVEYFEERRSLAIGIAICGSGVGSIIFSPLSKHLIDVFGWRGTLLIQAALLLNCVPCGLVMRPILERKESKEKITERTTHAVSKVSESYDVQRALLQNKQSKLETVEGDMDTATTINWSESNGAAAHNVNESSTVTENKRRKSTLKETRKTSTYSIVDESETRNEGWFDKINKLIHIRSLTNRKFMWIVISHFFEGMAYSVPFTFLPDMAVDIGYSRLQATWLMSTIAIANTGIRIPSGLLADVKHVNRLYVYLVALVGTGICIILLAFVKAYSVLLCICAFKGICIGCWVVLSPMVLTDLFGDDLIADTEGLTLFTAGIANLVGVPVAGVLFDASGQYMLTFVMAGIMYVSSGTILLFIHHYHRHHSS